MATHSSVLAWRIPGAGEPGGLRSMGSHSRTRLKRLGSSSRSICRKPKCLPSENSNRLYNKVPIYDTVMNKLITWLTCPSSSESENSSVCPTLCDPIDYIAHGILQVRILEWIAYLFSRGTSQPRNQTGVSCIAGVFFTSWATREEITNLQPNTINTIKILNGIQPRFLKNNNLENLGTAPFWPGVTAIHLEPEVTNNAVGSLGVRIQDCEVIIHWTICMS